MTSATRTKDFVQRDIRERSFSYALRAIRLYQYLEKSHDGAGKILTRQYLRAACSIGANVEEAQSGESRPDFIHKLSIAQKEARESCFWLRLPAESGIVAKTRLKPLLQETEELIAVITSIIIGTKRKSGTASVGRNS
jgi:four helix bundle protein